MVEVIPSPKIAKALRSCPLFLFQVNSEKPDTFIIPLDEPFGVDENALLATQICDLINETFKSMEITHFTITLVIQDTWEIFIYDVGHGSSTKKTSFDDIGAMINEIDHPVITYVLSMHFMEEQMVLFPVNMDFPDTLRHIFCENAAESYEMKRGEEGHDDKILVRGTTKVSIEREFEGCNIYDDFYE